ncbi:hypothetical protein CH381_24295 [Leptospira sp. mixed culture ATI2-C-A1]|nr:hypothetical protein CH381_24295 [Leptospira sp. mixed culture ATI2-C-A1]
MKRSDLSNYLIHFVHSKDPSQLPDHLPEYIENICYNFSYHISEYNEYSSLVNIIKEGGLRFGYSFRNKKTTLYGDSPVICFTEMPFSNFLEYVAKRNDKYKVSSYGIAFRKADLFKLGARPVIYGLSKNISNNYESNKNYERILNPNVLPYEEQYRLVSLNLNDSSKSDWTHEREWRLKLDKKAHEYIFCQKEGFEYCEIPGIHIFDKQKSIQETIIITQKKEEASDLNERIQILLDSGSNIYDVPVNNKIRILVIEEYLKSSSQILDISDLPESCFFSVNKPIISNDLLEKVKHHIEIAKNKVTEVAYKEFLKLQNRTETSDSWIDFGGPCGFGFIKCNSPNDKVLRAMIKLGIAN